MLPLSIMRSLYNKDFLVWTAKTSELIKNRQFDSIDWENVVEEIEALGRSERDKLSSSLKVLITHLLKWQFQPNHRTLNGENTIFRERENIGEYLEDIPSLLLFLESDEWLTKAYNRGKKIAIKETKLDASKFLRSCPYSLAELLNESFFPEATTSP